MICDKCGKAVDMSGGTCPNCGAIQRGKSNGSGLSITRRKPPPSRSKKLLFV